MRTSRRPPTLCACLLVLPLLWLVHWIYGAYAGTSFANGFTCWLISDCVTRRDLGERLQVQLLNHGHLLRAKEHWNGWSFKPHSDQHRNSLDEVFYHGALREGNNNKFGLPSNAHKLDQLSGDNQNVDQQRFGPDTRVGQFCRPADKCEPLLVRGRTLWPHLDYTNLWSEVTSLPSDHDLYPDSLDVDKVLYGLASARVERVELFGAEESALAVDEVTDLGSTHKWLIHLQGGQRAIFKPQWYGRHHIKEQWYLGFELHTSEIAAFHVDRLLGFRRSPFSVGRRLDMFREVLPVASKALTRKLTYTGGEVCITDTCYMCERPLVSCSRGGVVEGAVIMFLNNLTAAQPSAWGAKTYFRHKKYGFNNQTYCSAVRSAHPLLSSQSVFLDVMDMAVLDYITFHFDAKFYSLRSAFNVHTTVHLDRGRALTRTDRDDELAMLGLWQCCRMRNKTYKRLLDLQEGHLLVLLRKELSRDPISPPEVLTTNHLEAIQRRLAQVISLVNKCVDANGWSNTLFH